MLGVSSPGMCPVLAYDQNQRGRVTTSGASFTTALRSILSGIHGLPQSRPLAKDQSSVRMIPLAPASRARTRRSSMVSRSPDQYIWKSTCELTAQTSSIDRLANELSPMATPRLAAARATATSPSGWTAWTPVGEINTGIETDCPMTVVAIVRSRLLPATCGAKPNWSKDSRLSLDDSPLSDPATSAA